MTTFSRYVALGDSTTEGLDDPYPAAAGGELVYRGWADRLAERLAAVNPDLLYANLAVRGRLMAAIHEEQLEPALAMEPDLASVIGGVNDVLRPKVDLDALGGHMRAMQSALIAQGATVLGMTLPDLGDSMGVARIVSERLAAYNQLIRDVAADTGAIVVDIEREAPQYDPACWSEDRLHANAKGHELIALAAADALDLPGAAEELAAIIASAAPVVHRGRLREAAYEAAWAWNHLRPWIVRRLRGRSSGDGIEPKRPRLEPVASDAGAEREAAR